MEQSTIPRVSWVFHQWEYHFQGENGIQGFPDWNGLLKDDAEC